jgi:hypothetical protein
MKSQLLMVILFLVMYLVAYLIFLIMSLNLFRESYGILRAHLAMIWQGGIDPLKTPTRRKMRMLQRLKEIGLIVFLVFVVSTFCTVWNLIPIWVAYLVVLVGDFVFYSVMCYLCRIREEMVATYRDDIDLHSVSEDDGKDLIEWHPGMPLPPLPRENYCSEQVHDAPPNYEEPGLPPDAKNLNNL